MRRNVGATAAVAILATAFLACGPDTDEDAVNQPATEEVAPQPAPAPTTTQPTDAAAMLAIHTADPYGDFLTDASGRALYMFSADQQGQSACDQECARVWEPLTLGNGQMNPATTPGAEPGAENPQEPTTAQPETGETAQPQAAQPSASFGQIQQALVGTIQRTDGTTQITYNGHPLYYYAEDQTAGEVKGQDVKGFGGEWYLVSPSGEKVESGKSQDQGTS